MALDEIFAFVTQQIATIASIFVIVLSAVWKINRRADDRDKKLRNEIKQTAEELEKKNKDEFEVWNRLLNQRLEYIEREITRVCNNVTRIDESVRQHHEHHN